MNNFKGLVWYKKILYILLGILISPLIILGLVMALVAFFFIMILPSPYEIIKYIKSPYFKVLKRKYTLGITRSDTYQIYNFLYSINKHEEIDFSSDVFLSDDENIYIWFYYDEIWHDEKSNKWMTSVHDGSKAMELETFAENLIEKISEENSFKKVHFLVQEDIFTDDKFDLVLTNSDFMIYKDIKDLGNILTRK